MKYQNKFVLSCDWLQIHVQHKANFLEIGNVHYRLRRVGQSKVFRDIFEIKDLTGNVVATYCTGAQECIMEESEGILKIENKQLYCHDNLRQWIEKLLERLHFKFLSVTRFDIAFDFQKFYMDVDPKSVIVNYFNGKYLRVAYRKSKFKAGFYCEQQGLKMDYQTMSLGSKSSNINGKLYNKTQELKDNYKPWIANLHKEEFNNSEDVWRLEFSLYSMTAFLKGEGKEFAFHSLDILDLPNMYGMFIGLFNKHFRFKKNRGEDRLTRMKDVTLWIFDLSFTELRMVAQNPMFKQSNRAEKIFIKKMNEVNNYLRGYDEVLGVTGKQFLGKAIALWGLESEADRRGIDYEKAPNYMANIHEYTQIVANEASLNEAYDKAIAGVVQYNNYLSSI